MTDIINFKQPAQPEYTTNTAYKEGYDSYHRWLHQQSDDKPINPHLDEYAEGNVGDYNNWQIGWDDASFDLTR